MAMPILSFDYTRCAVSKTFSMKSKEKLLAELRYFTGTTQWFKHPMFPNYVYTDGIKYLAVNAECYWLLEHIFIHQSIPAIKVEEFQVWKLAKEGNKATITIENGNGKIVKTFAIPYTDFPLEDFSLWFIGNTLLLPSEY